MANMAELPYCPVCGAPKRGLEDEICPSCGYAFPGPDDEPLDMNDTNDFEVP